MPVTKTAITTATDTGYLPAACCQLKSVADNLPANRDVSLFLVCCDVSEADIAAARLFFKTKNVPAEVIIPDFIEEKVKPINKRWPRAAYLRLYFDMIFGAEYDRLIYFDADTRVLSSIEPLIDVELDDFPVAAVHDFVYYLTGNIRRRRRDLFLNDDAPYLQSGVMVFDWPKLLESGALEVARQFLVDHPERCMEAPDQDALNHALEGRWKPLDPRWNLHETYLNFGGKLKPCLEHYTSTKPWSKRRPPRWNDAANWYRNELRDTIWSDFIPEQSSADKINAQMDFLKFRYAPKVRNALAAYAPFALDLIKVPRHRSDDAELPWAPRNNRDVEVMTLALVSEANGERAFIRPPEAVLDGYGTGLPIGLS